MEGTQTSWLAIRVDGDSVIGLGHVMRCLALAEAARDRGFAVHLLARSLDDSLLARLEAAAVGLHRLTRTQPDPVARPYFHSEWLAVDEQFDAEEAGECLARLTDRYGPPAALVVDHYALGRPWHSKLRAVAPILVIDELADRPLAPDWLLDQTVGRSPADYSGLIPESARLLLEGNFALLRREFAVAASRLQHPRPPLRSPVRVLVTLGAVDRANVAAKILTGLKQVAAGQPIEVTLVLGGGSVHADGLAEQISCTEFPATLLTDVSNMAELMSVHDLAIGAAGTTAWERCALGLPSLTVILADNQQHVAEHLAAAGAAVNLGSAATLTADLLAAELVSLCGDPDRYAAMSAAAFNVTDGGGCERVLDILADSGSA